MQLSEYPNGLFLTQASQTDIREIWPSFGYMHFKKQLNSAKNIYKSSNPSFFLLNSKQGFLRSNSITFRINAFVNATLFGEVFFRKFLLILPMNSHLPNTENNPLRTKKPDQTIFIWGQTFAIANDIFWGRMIHWTKYISVGANFYEVDNKFLRQKMILVASNSFFGVNNCGWIIF